MNNLNLKEIVENLIDTFIHAGKISLDLRKQGLIKKIKADNTPVSNGDLEVNKIVTQKIKELTPELPIISEEASSWSVESFLYVTQKNILQMRLVFQIDPVRSR